MASVAVGIPLKASNEQKEDLGSDLGLKSF